MPLRLSIARGPRAAEEVLLARLSDLADEAREEPGLLARPVRVLVPSRALRLHLCDRIVHAGGERALLGVVVQPLFALASEVLARAGRPMKGGDARLELVARTLAGEERALRLAYGAFEDGLDTAVASIRDLIDAGLDEDTAAALGELLGETPLSRAERERARALVRVAIEARTRLAEGGRPHTGYRASLLEAAAEALRESRDRVLPTRQLFVHGFAEATGRAADLIEELTRCTPSELLLDHPPDPGSPAEVDPAARFTERLREHFQGALPEDTPGPPPPPASLLLLAAPNPDAEALAVARRIRVLLDGGARPEGIGVVVRGAERYPVPLRRWFSRLGIPFSALALQGPSDGPGRRLRALAELLEEGEGATADRWLDSLGDIGRAALPLTAELRVALRELRAVRLGEVADLRPPKRGVPLPIPCFAEGSRATRVRFDPATLAATARSARDTKQALAELPARATAGAHLAALLTVLRETLGWAEDQPAWERAVRALTILAEELDSEELAPAAFLRLAARALREAAATPLGGAGAGVQLLESVEARGRTFEHLFLVGVNRGAWPRPVREDLAFPDGVRRKLTEVLPDLPIKARARLEDRYLFASLLASSPDVTLTWAEADEAGKRLVLSPLAERLRVGEAPIREERAPEVLAQAAGDDIPVDARAFSIAAGLSAGQEGFAAALAGRAAAGSPAPGAAVRPHLLAALEAGSRAPQRAAPWLGFLGPRTPNHPRLDLRGDGAEAPFVTKVERFATCPWQATLQPLVSPADAADPLAALPSLERRTLGDLVHAVLQRIDERALGESPGTLSEAARREPVAVPLPSRSELVADLQREARKALGQEATRFEVLVSLYAACALPYVERGLELRDDATGEGVLACESEGIALVEGDGESTLGVRFRADRVERRDGTLVITDYKSGKSPGSAKEHMKQLSTGEKMQAFAYALSASELSERGVGRYAYLGEDATPEKAVVAFDSAASEFAEQRRTFAEVLGVVQTSLDEGAAFPRMARPGDKANKACEYCTLRLACPVDDSSMRRALEAWADDAAGPAGGDALRSLYRLGEGSGKRTGAKRTATPKKGGGDGGAEA